MTTGYPPIPPSQINPPCRRHGSQRSRSYSDGTRSSGGRRKKKYGFSSKIQIPEFEGKKGHTHDVAGAFCQLARCITYYRDYYEDSYLMPLVVSSLTETPPTYLTDSQPQSREYSGSNYSPPDVREHYCGSLTFREKYYRESLPKASGGCHRLFNKDRYLHEQLG